jgi:hypothetical protein
MTLDAQAVMALAPDESSAKAARGLVSPAKWPTLGVTEAAVWGECLGSGSKPYQTQVDRAGPAFRCSCPSRKFPCKHGLALLLLHASDATRFGAGPPPAWVSEWLEGRAAKAQKQEAKQEAQREQERQAAADPEAARAAAESSAAAAAKREAQRWARIDTAATDLRRWLADVIGRGLGVQSPDQRAAWETQAARLVDAQAPGLAQRVRQAAACLSSTTQAEALLAQLGLLQLACDALQRREQLPPPEQDDLRALLGWPHDRDEVLARGEAVADRWWVMGQALLAVDARLTERRVWLIGQRSGRRALLLDHAHNGQGFTQAWRVFASIDTTLHFHPGSAALRALAGDPQHPSAPDGDPAGPSPVPSTDPPWPLTSLASEWSAIAARIAARPWHAQQPLLLSDAVVLRDAAGAAVQAGGERLPLRIGADALWPLLAQGGGRPMALFGEWDGQALRPLAARGEDGDWQLGFGALDEGVL